MKGAGLLQKILPRLARLPEGSGVSFEDALQGAVEAIAKRLWAKRSELVKRHLELDAEPEPFNLPADFMGLAEDPYAVSLPAMGTRSITPLPPAQLPEFYGKTGSPQHYRIMGRQIELFPAPEGAYEVRGEYYAKPATGLTVDLPWHGLFDEVIEDAAVRISAAGDRSILVDRAFQEVIRQQVDDVLASRTNPAPRRVRARFL